MSVLGDNVTSLAPRSDEDEAKDDDPTGNDGTHRQERGRSTIGFPYDDLDAATTIANEVHNTYGGQATMVQIAASLGQTVKSGAFRVKVSAARLFGLVTVSRETAIVTDLGRRVLDPQITGPARAEAFLKVPLYGELYGRFKDGTLPDDTGLSAAIAELGVTAKQVQTARQVFQRSAQQAGFFRFGNRRLVLPATNPTTPPDAPQPQSKPDSTPIQRGPDVDDLVKHPFILGLLRELPNLGTDFTAEARETWLAAAKIAFDLIYGKPRPGDEGRRET